MPKHKSRKQKPYNMVGCSSKKRRHLGGATLAYTGKPIFHASNPHLAYTGKGGAPCGLSRPVIAPVNLNAANPSIPNTGPPLLKSGLSFNFDSAMRGGSCSACMVGGSHRDGCKCSECKRGGQNGGSSYPDGLVGSTWTSNVSSWPGVDGVPGNSNHYPMNTYHTDISRQMVNSNVTVPHKGGKRRRQKGGTLSNFMSQDLINLGRQFQFGVGSAYNALAGHSSPVNPLPWKDQLTTNTPLHRALL